MSLPKDKFQQALEKNVVFFRPIETIEEMVEWVGREAMTLPDENGVHRPFVPARHWEFTTRDYARYRSEDCWRPIVNGRMFLMEDDFGQCMFACINPGKE